MIDWLVQSQHHRDKRSKNKASTICNFEADTRIAIFLVILIKMEPYNKKTTKCSTESQKYERFHDLVGEISKKRPKTKKQAKKSFVIGSSSSSSSSTATAEQHRPPRQVRVIYHIHHHADSYHKSTGGGVSISATTRAAGISATKKHFISMTSLRDTARFEGERVA